MKETKETDINKASEDLPKKAPVHWLQRLKDESWEAELLVSAIAIFGTFQLFGLIDWLTNLFINILNPRQYVIGYIIVFLGLLAFSILASMFVIHFFLRAYWIGLVGLNSVFPDYSIKDSAYSEIYTEKMLAILPKLEDSIKKVDELCSVIFSAAFTLLMIYIYIGLFASVYLFIYNMLASKLPSYILLIPLGLLAIGLVLQSVLTILSNLKPLKAKKGLQILNFGLVKVVSMIIYGPLYKYILQVSMIFGSNFKKKKSIVYLILVFFLAGMFVSLYQLSKTNIPYLMNRNAYFDDTRLYSSYYEVNNDNNDFLLTPEIASEEVNSAVVKLFIPVFKNESKLSKETCGTYVEDASKSKSEKLKEEGIHFLECYKKYHAISVNGKSLPVEFLRYSHHKTQQFGILGYAELTDVNSGRNTLEIKKLLDDGEVREWSIPFYYSMGKLKENKGLNL